MANTNIDVRLTTESEAVPVRFQHACFARRPRPNDDFKSFVDIDAKAIHHFRIRLKTMYSDDEVSAFNSNTECNNTHAQGSSTTYLYIYGNEHMLTDT